MESSNVPFPDIDPYEELQVKQSVTPTELKKCYRKLMLRYHPDKTNDWTPEAKEKFHKIQFAFEVLDKFKDTFDRTQSIEACFAGESLADWKDLFDTDVVIDRDTIAQDKARYQGSSDETQDIIESWNSNEQAKPSKRYTPDDDQFTLLFQEIPHIEATDDDEAYIHERISALLADKLITDSNGSFQRWSANRKKYLKSMQKRLAKEAKQADDMLANIQDSQSAKAALGDEDQLRQLIQKKNKTSFDSLISKLENQATSKGKRTKRKTGDIDDDQFERLQAKMAKRRQR
ncbi:LADA_0C11386g1_1 [Lachancea dasiensis]|uniref:LADA_0C11386g1_1 n=1 Tax=Lachancea dasiensis TaxID=1072105 RepID=A0A1G4J1C4_9SACH|nr:LADA_0C11386g1_1 [Lachancea dasiensis]